MASVASVASVAPGSRAKSLHCWGTMEQVTWQTARVILQRPTCSHIVPCCFWCRVARQIHHDVSHLWPHSSYQRLTPWCFPSILTPACNVVTLCAGTIAVFDLKVPKDLAEVRKSMGFCPQHDVLFPAMTVVQHLDLFSTLAGRTRSLGSQIPWVERSWSPWSLHELGRFYSRNRSSIT